MAKFVLQFVMKGVLIIHLKHNIKLILLDILTGSVYVTLFIGILRYKYFTTEIKYIFFYVAFSAFTELFTDLYTALWLKNTMPIGHFYIPISIVIIGLCYSQLLKFYVNPKLIIGILILYVLFAAVNVAFIQSLFEFPNIVGVIGATIMIIFSIVFFSKIMAEAKIRKLSDEPIIWINTAVLLFYAANFFWYILYNYNLRVSKEFAVSAVKFYWVMGILFYILLTIGFWKTKKASEIINTI